jgi:predicted GNAT family N-acyltransferase
VGFYTQFGFEKEGQQFEEAGIQHYKMVLKK